MSNYIDPDTIDNIMKSRKKTEQIKVPVQAQPAGTEHHERIAKMKELYGLFVKMENEQPAPASMV